MKFFNKKTYNLHITKDDALDPEELRKERPEIAEIIEGAKERRKSA